MLLAKFKTGRLKLWRIASQMYTSKVPEEPKFEAVFTFPFIKYIALFNRLKVYHIIGSGVAVPSCGLLEMVNVLSEQSFLSAASIDPDARQMLEEMKWKPKLYRTSHGYATWRESTLNIEDRRFY